MRRWGGGCAGRVEAGGFDGRAGAVSVGKRGRDELVPAEEREHESGGVLGAVLVQRQAVRGISTDAGRGLAATAAQATGHVFGTMFGRGGSAQAGVDVEPAGNGGAIGDRVFSIGDERCRGLGSDLEDAAQFEMVFDCSAKEPGDVQVRSEPVQHERQHGAGAAPVQRDCKRHAGAAADGVSG